MYVHVYTCHMFVVVVLASYICMYEHVQNSKSTQQRILVITSPCWFLIMRHLSMWWWSFSQGCQLTEYGITYSVTEYAHVHTEEEGTRVMYVHCTIQYDTNPYARVINNNLTTIFIKLIPANLAPCHLTRGDQRTHGTACLRPLPPT